MLSKWMSQTCSTISDQRDRTIAVAHQELEQRVFLGLEVDGPAAARDNATHRVDFEVGQLESRLLRRAAAQQRTQPRGQLGQRKRLAHVVVGSRVQPRDSLLE